jgi:hypothetical protein
LAPKKSAIIGIATTVAALTTGGIIAARHGRPKVVVRKNLIEAPSDSIYFDDTQSVSKSQNFFGKLDPAFVGKVYKISLMPLSLLYITAFVLAMAAVIIAVMLLLIGNTWAEITPFIVVTGCAVVGLLVTSFVYHSIDVHYQIHYPKIHAFIASVNGGELKAELAKYEMGK